MRVSAVNLSCFSYFIHKKGKPFLVPVQEMKVYYDIVMKKDLAIHLPFHLHHQPCPLPSFSLLFPWQSVNKYE